MLVQIYRFARLGMQQDDIAEAVGVDRSTFGRWKKINPDVGIVLKWAHQDQADKETWQKFVYDRLSPDVRTVWDRITSYEGDEKNGIAKIEALLEDHGKHMRQELFLYALVHSNFSASKACSKVNISRHTMDDWIEKDPAFADLIKEIEWHKDNFFEEAFISLVAVREPSVVLHAAKSRLDSRGYSARQKVDVSGSIDHTHSLIDLSELNLTQEVKQAILQAMREREERIEREKNTKLIPVEARVLNTLVNEISNVPV